jgi:hypothetical protein
MRSSLILRFLTTVLVLFLVGCGGRKTYPVEGKIVYKDGSPATGLAGGNVEFDSVEQPVSAQGTIQSDGSFSLGTDAPGDGAVPGKHRVVIALPLPLDQDKPPPPAIDSRYHTFETSGLEVTVEPKLNKVTLEVEPPKR